MICRWQQQEALLIPALREGEGKRTEDPPEERDMERMVELSLSATHSWRPSRERARPEGCAQLVEEPALPFWLRSYPSPLNAAVAPVLMSCLHI